MGEVEGGANICQSGGTFGGDGLGNLGTLDGLGQGQAKGFLRIGTGGRLIGWGSVVFGRLQTQTRGQQVGHRDQPWPAVRPVFSGFPMGVREVARVDSASDSPAVDTGRLRCLGHGQFDSVFGHQSGPG
ncbi:MAG: hypothetical protein ABSC41_10870 [Acidimicrobiales bacterium]